VLPISLLLGFIIPTVLAGVPPPILTTIPQQQALLIFWQGFPIWIAIWQHILTITSSIVKTTTDNARSTSVMLTRLRRIYSFAISLTSLVHITTILFATAPSLRPPFFTSPLSPQVMLKSVFLPISPLSTTKVETLPQGCLILLQYDLFFACGAALLWATVVLYRSKHQPMRWEAMIKALFLSLLFGPGGAALALIWQRDETIFGGSDRLLDKVGKNL
jgi:hypothetical protein